MGSGDGSAARPLGQFRIQADHPCLPGHFPGRPVVPGVLLLEEAASLLLAARPGERVAAYPAAKFTRPVLPGEDVAVSCSPGGRDGEARTTVVLSCAVGGQVVLRATANLLPDPGTTA